MLMLSGSRRCGVWAVWLPPLHLLSGHVLLEDVLLPEHLRGSAQQLEALWGQRGVAPHPRPKEDTGDPSQDHSRALEIQSVSTG